jgi:hypothetical protein
MDPWYKVATPRKEVREGRSFNPDEFAIAPEQVVAGNPQKFSLSRALRGHSKKDNSAPGNLAIFASLIKLGR